MFDLWLNQLEVWGRYVQWSAMFLRNWALNLELCRSYDASIFDICLAGQPSWTVFVDVRLCHLSHKMIEPAIIYSNTWEDVFKIDVSCYRRWYWTRRLLFGNTRYAWPINVKLLTALLGGRSFDIDLTTRIRFSNCFGTTHLPTTNQLIGQSSTCLTSDSLR